MESTMKWMAIFVLTILFPAIIAAQQTNWQALANRIPGLDARRLRHLEQSYTMEETEPNMLKMTHRLTGMVKYVDISDRQFDFKNPPPDAQVIDLTTIDTSLYNQHFKRWRMYPIGGASGYPMAIGDFNNNGLLDFAGTYKIEQNLEYLKTAVGELQADSSFIIHYIYGDSSQLPIAATDTDGDGLLELNFRAAQDFKNYEAPAPDSFPTVLNLRHRMWYSGGAVGYERFSHLDGDSLIDVVYIGDDALSPPCEKIYVAEYDPVANRFVETYDTCPPKWGTGCFSIGDFDEDGYPEFATGQVNGHYYIIEASGNDQYEMILQDTISAANAYLTGETNDIDGNGQIEFFMGGSSFWNGIASSLVYWIEADGNNSYRKVRRFFLRGTEVFGLTKLYIHDVDADGIDDLVFTFEELIVILRWNNKTRKFEIFHIDKWESNNQNIWSVNIFDVFNSGFPDLMVNVEDFQTVPRIRTYLYRANLPTGIAGDFNQFQDYFKLDQNTPNPFNNSTQIRFHLSQPGFVNLRIFDITGKEVNHLIENKKMSLGEYETKWNGLTNTGKEASSGIYFYVLTVLDHAMESKLLHKEVKKMILTK